MSGRQAAPPGDRGAGDLWCRITKQGPAAPSYERSAGAWASRSVRVPDLSIRPSRTNSRVDRGPWGALVPRTARPFRSDHLIVGLDVPSTDVQWARIEPLLPDRTPSRGGRWRNHREVIDAIAFTFRTGTQWAHLPGKYDTWQGVCNLRVPRRRGRPHTRPDAVLADKASSSRAIRRYLRRRGIRAVMPVPAAQQDHRLHRGSRGGRPPAFDIMPKSIGTLPCASIFPRASAPPGPWDRNTPTTPMAPVNLTESI